MLPFDPIYVMVLGMLGVVVGMAVFGYLFWRVFEKLDKIAVASVITAENTTGQLKKLPESMVNPVRTLTIERYLTELMSTDPILDPRRAEQLVGQLAFHIDRLQNEVESVTAQFGQPTISVKAIKREDMTYAGSQS